MQVAATCPECGSGTQLEVSSVEQAEYVGCPDCGHRFLWESAGGGAPGEAVVRVPHTAVAEAREALNGDLGDGITSETLATSGTLKGLQRRLAGRK